MTDEITFRSDMTVELVDHMGNDRSIARAARVSTMGEESREDTGSIKGLINFLMRDKHGSPFEHNSMTFLISAPIFVFREFHRHRVGWSYSEESGRYRKLQPVFYVPGEDRKLVQVGKPGAYEFVEGDPDQHDVATWAMQGSYRWAYQAYRNMLAAGIAREVARTVLPVSLYSTMYATCNARSLMSFLSLRTRHPDAAHPSFPQREIEMVAEGMEKIFSDLFPITHAAYNGWHRVAP